MSGRALAADDLGRSEFWAVQDVSFRVQPGEVLGIIGANGAGKSTVLKLLTRILRPTRGRIHAPGRIGALIEVAAGFHPDLSGRENVYLQGAIMGMRTKEIARKFDDIVSFADVGDFIDTPVKRFSSGMNARLGFAIAAHLEPDVLVTDEVLSVGDFAFQTRAFDRLTQMAKSGIPVIVVSHQLDRVASLCTRALVLDRGAVVHEGRPAECVAWYASHSMRSTGAEAQGPVHLTGLTTAAAEAKSGSRFSLRVTGEVRSRDDLASVEAVGVRLRSTGTGEIVSVTSSRRCGVTIDEVGPFAVDVEMQLNVPPGVYMVEVHPYDSRGRRPLQQSLSAAVTVLEGPDFVGRVQLNTRMRLAPGE
jgi:lipopolysaccharide transport system ATP-binding protein